MIISKGEGESDLLLFEWEHQEVIQEEFSIFISLIHEILFP
jgi:hypothetical protein